MWAVRKNGSHKLKRGHGCAISRILCMINFHGIVLVAGTRPVGRCRCSQGAKICLVLGCVEWAMLWRMRNTARNDLTE